MAFLADLIVKLGADDSELDSGLGQAESKVEKFSKGLKVAAAAGGAAAGAVLAVGFAKSLEFGDAQGKLEAQLGVTGARAEELGEIAGNLYAGAWGDSLGQVNEALRSVVQSGAVMEDASSEQLESVTSKVLDLATAFDQDVAGAANAVGQVMRSGLAPDAETALDVITRGFQQGVDKAGDFLDTLNEYSTQFRKLGLDATTATGLMSQGLKAGARDADLVADALKEFSIRAIDGSKLTVEGFTAVGLSAADMAGKIAAGGPTASAALDMTLDRLRAMEDPVKRDAAAVALFGTQAEDLGAALLALDPSSAAGALGDVAGATDQVRDSLATAQEAITAKQRAVEMWVASLVTTEGPLGSVAASMMAFGEPALAMAGNVGMIALAVKGLGVTSLLAGAKMAAAWLLAFWPIALVVAAVVGLAALIYYHWDTIKRWTGEAWDWVVGKVSGAWDWIKDTVGGAIDWVVSTVKGGWDQLVSLAVWLRDMIIFRIHELAYRLRTAWDNIVAGVVGLKDAVVNKFNEVVGYVTGIPGRVVSALGNISGMLYNSGVAMVSGFWDGLVARWNQMLSWLRSGIARVRDLFPFSPAKDGPFSGRGYVTYSGEALTDDFARSLLEGMPRVAAAAAALAHSASTGLDPTALRAQLPSLSGLQVPRGVSAAASGSNRPVVEFRGPEAIMELLRKTVRQEGGDVQLVFGR